MHMNMIGAIVLSIIVFLIENFKIVSPFCNSRWSIQILYEGYHHIECKEAMCLHF